MSLCRCAGHSDGNGTYPLEQFFSLGRTHGHEQAAVGFGQGFLIAPRPGHHLDMRVLLSATQDFLYHFHTQAGRFAIATEVQRRIVFGVQLQGRGLQARRQVQGQQAE